MTSGEAVLASVELSPDLLQRARQLAVDDGISVLASLQAITHWPAPMLMGVLGQAFRYPVVDEQKLEALTPQFQSIGLHECMARGVLSARDGEGVLWLILGDPFNAIAEEWAWNRCANQGEIPKITLVHAEALQTFLTSQEHQMQAMEEMPMAREGQDHEEVAADITLAAIAAETSAIVKLVNSTLYDALKLKASDVHLECDAGSLHVLFRIDGVLVPITQLHSKDGAPENAAEQVISRIKVMAELDIAERRIPQDGRFKVRVNSRTVDFRVSVMPSIFGEDAVLRLLDRQTLTQEAQALSLVNLGLDADSILRIRQLAKKPHGMLLVTGPTGSGKTTTLYAAITEVNTGRDKIVTIEDPVEYRLPRVLQIPVNEKKGLTFARGLRSILRHDPDKIMVGEIRDSETAQIAVQAALTGHLVYTSVHANNVFDVLGRFLHMGVDGYSFAAALNGIVAQRLLRLTCEHCAEEVAPDTDALRVVGLSNEQVVGWKFRAGRGCSHCRGAGYKGRKAIAEVLILDDSMRELIAAKAPISHLKERAMVAGFRSLKEVALQCISNGETTLEEIERVAS